MRKVPKNQPRSAYDYNHQDAKDQSGKYDYEYESHYSYNYDYKDSYYQTTSEDWNCSKSQSTEFLNYKLPQKHKDSYERGSETTYPSMFKRSYNEYYKGYDKQHSNNDQNYNKNPHKVNKHQYSLNGNSEYQGKLNNKAIIKKFKEGRTPTDLIPEARSKLPTTDSIAQSTQKFNAPSKQQQSKDSNIYKLNNNLGNVKPNLFLNVKHNEYNAKAEAIHSDAEKFSDKLKLPSESSKCNDYSNSKKVQKKKHKKNQLEGELTDNHQSTSKKIKFIKEANKIEELSSDLETLNDVNITNHTQRIVNLPQYQAPVYFVSPVINQIPPSQFIGANLGYIPQFAHPMNQLGFLNIHNQSLGSRMAFSNFNQQTLYPYEINRGNSLIKDFAYNVIPESNMNMIRFTGGQSNMVMPSYNPIIDVPGNNNFNSQNFSSHEQPLGIQRVQYLESGYPMQKQSEFQNCQTIENQQAKDIPFQNTCNKYALQLQMNQTNSQNVNPNKSQNASNGAWTSQSEQFPSESHIHPLLLGPKVSIRNQFAQKEDSSTNVKQNAQGASNGIDFCGSTQNETKIVQLSGGLESEENENDKLAFLQSLQSLQSDDCSLNKGIKDMTISKEDFDYKNVFHFNGISVTATPQFEDSNYRAKTRDDSPDSMKEKPSEFFNLSFDYDEPSQADSVELKA